MSKGKKWTFNEKPAPAEPLVVHSARDVLRGNGAAAKAPPKPPKPAKPPIFTWRDVPPVWTLEANVTWIISGLIPEGALTLLTGDSGVGKTLLGMSIAGAIVHGQPFLGRETTQRMVLYLDRENSLAVVKQRLFDLKIRATDDLVYWGGWCEYPPDGPTAKSLLDLAGERKPVIIFDSLIAFHPGDEQDASETRRFLQWFRKLASAGATIILLHHIGKSDGAKQYRGSSDIKASVDVAYLLERSSGGPADLLTDLRLVPFKNRIGAGAPLQLMFANGGFERQVRSETVPEVIERLVRASTGSSYEELVTRARSEGLAKNQAEEELSKGAKDGRFEVRKIRRKSCYFIREVELGEV